MTARRVRWPFILVRLIALGAGLANAGCVAFPPTPERSVRPRFETLAGSADQPDDGTLIGGETLESFDGVHLPVRRWSPPTGDTPRAVIIALHGMNDHAGMFAETATFWAADYGIETISYDQRGFGRGVERGRWAGTGAMQADLAAAVAAARERHPAVPLYILGHSMGAAVILSSFSDYDGDGDGEAALQNAYGRDIRDAADGVILAAPAVWGGGELPVFYRLALNLAAGLAPGKTLTGERAARQASDNIEALRAMARDPLMIRETRIDAVLGVVRLMDAAWRGARDISADSAPPRFLMLVGEKDEIIPVDAQEKLQAELAKRLGDRLDATVFPEGWHLLFRDLQRRNVWIRVGDWIVGERGVVGAGPAPPDS